ncbi:MAG: YceI family protein [bacterium]
MHTNIKASLFALALVMPLSGAWSAANELLVLQPQSRLWIDGSSTMKRWTCKAGAVNAIVEANGPNAIATLLTGDKGVRTVRVTVPAAQIDCDNGTMNEHMRKALKLADHPSIDFRLTTYDVARNADGVTGTMTGTLSLGGVEKTITMKAEGKSEDAMLHITGSYPLNMKDYDLKPPTLMFGRIKVGETVTVNFDLLLKS